MCVLTRDEILWNEVTGYPSYIMWDWASFLTAIILFCSGKTYYMERCGGFHSVKVLEKKRQDADLGRDIQHAWTTSGKKCQHNTLEGAGYA